MWKKYIQEGSQCVRIHHFLASLTLVRKYLAELCSIVLWRVKRVSHKTGWLAEDISIKMLKEQLGFSLVLIER
jgi:hypothetical protein